MSTTSNESKVSTILKGARRAETTVMLCMRPDVQAEVDALENRLRDLNDQDQRLVQSNEQLKLADQIRALTKEADESRIEFKFAALPSSRWRAITSANLPEFADSMNGYEATRLAQLADIESGIQAATESLVGARAFGDDEWEPLEPGQLADLFENINDGQRRAVSNAVQQLNGGESQVPKSLLASFVTPTPSEKSGSPEPGASPAEGSTETSRKSDTSTETLPES